MRAIAGVSGLSLWISVNAFAGAAQLVAVAAASGISLLAFEVVKSRRSKRDQEDHNNA